MTHGIKINDHRGKTSSWWEGFNEARDKRNEERRDREKNLQAPNDTTVVKKDPREKRITHQSLRVVKYRVVLSLLANAVKKKHKRSDKFPIRHLWFKENNIDKYELRKGNPPADVDRPDYLKRLPLQVDIGEVPDNIWDYLETLWEMRTRVPKAVSELDITQFTNDRYLHSGLLRGDFDK